MAGVFRVTLDDDVIATADEVEVAYGGALVCNNSDGLTELVLASGQWDAAFWEEEE